MSRRLAVAFLVLPALVAVLSALIYTLLAGSTTPSSIGWGEFLQNISDGTVSRIVQQGTTLTVTDPSGIAYTVAAPGNPNVNSDYLVDFQRAAANGGRTFDNTIYTIEPPNDSSWIGLVLTGILPLIIIGGFVYFMTRQARRQWAVSGGPNQFRAPPPTLADRLRQLDEAKAAGLITPDEYEAKRRQIVDGL
jgi:ATP-dependent Zn protease